MLKEGNSVFVWLHDAWARLVLDAPETTPKSRWVAHGKVVRQGAEGIWLESGRIEEWKADEKSRIAWKFTPKTLLLQWQAIITVQVAESVGEKIGFNQERVGG